MSGPCQYGCGYILDCPGADRCVFWEGGKYVGPKPKTAPMDPDLYAKGFRRLGEGGPIFSPGMQVRHALKSGMTLDTIRAGMMGTGIEPGIIEQAIRDEVK